MNHYLSVIWLCAIIGCFVGCTSNQEAITQAITLTNTSPVNLADKPVVVPREQLKVPNGILYPVLVNQKGDTIPSQLDDIDGDKQWDELFFVITLSARKSDTLHLGWTESEPRFTQQTGIRFGVRQTVSSK